MTVRFVRYSVRLTKDDLGNYDKIIAHYRQKNRNFRFSQFFRDFLKKEASKIS